MSGALQATFMNQRSFGPPPGSPLLQRCGRPQTEPNAVAPKEESRVKSSQVANPRNAFCIEQRATAKPKEAQLRVFGLFLLLPRLAPVGLIAR